MHYDKYQFSSDYLTSGERILWKGCPGKGNLLRKADIVFIPFSLFWCGIVFYLVGSNLMEEGINLIFLLFDIFFASIGGYILFGRFVHHAYMRKRTFYVITTEKILRKRGKKIDYLYFKNIPDVHVEYYKDGKGTIGFQEISTRGTIFREEMINVNLTEFCLDNIPDVRLVHKLIANAWAGV